MQRCVAQLNRKSTIGLENMTSVHAAVANSTAKTVIVEKIGNTVDINVGIKLASAVSAYQVLFYLPAGYRPTTIKYVRPGSNPTITIDSQGKVQVQGDYATNVFITFGRTYTL